LVGRKWWKVIEGKQKGHVEHISETINYGKNQYEWVDCEWRLNSKGQEENKKNKVKVQKEEPTQKRKLRGTHKIASEIMLGPNLKIFKFMCE
jgi:hypothetical protein